MTTFKLVQNVEGKFTVTTFTPQNVIAEMEVRGHVVNGCCDNLRVRKELFGQPTFSGVLGPMWDGTDDFGNAVIRYETQEAYNILSV